MSADPAIIRPAEGDDDMAEIRRLLLEYADSLDFSLCFQDFDAELAGLPGAYAPPRGRLLLAAAPAGAAGGVGLRPLGSETCEMKRLYVRPAFRGLGLGRRLAAAILDEARAIGYRTVLLDTIGGTMKRAETLYRDLGFLETPPYYHNPHPEVRYYRLDLRGGG